VVVDGFICGAAALTATRIAPAVAASLIASHRSVEAGHRAVLKAIGQRPLLDLDLRLGEGTGAVLAMSLVESALAIVREMATFSSAGVSDRGG
jgi:nicotinate-nucleotide--dimethylbenzimidazole phosphoribosyltransferase